MGARRTDALRMMEAVQVMRSTLAQVRELGFDRQRFLHPSNALDDLAAEGIASRVFRVAEELGALNEVVLRAIGYERSDIRGVRNRLARVYGEADRGILWSVVETDFPAMLEACEAYMDVRGWGL